MTVRQIMENKRKTGQNRPDPKTTEEHQIIKRRTRKQSGHPFLFFPDLQNKKEDTDQSKKDGTGIE